MPLFRNFYVCELKPGGSLKELSGLVETQLKGTYLHVGEASQDSLGNPYKLEQDQIFRSNVAFLMMQQLSLNIMTNILSQRKAPSAIISFDSPALGRRYAFDAQQHRPQRIPDEFKKEADFIGYFVLQHPPQAQG